MSYRNEIVYQQNTSWNEVKKDLESKGIYAVSSLTTDVNGCVRVVY
jgi:hypothetical protein